MTEDGDGLPEAPAAVETEPAGSWLSSAELDLVRIASTLRTVMPRVDDEARERLEAAWVALLNAVKQPKADAARLARRVSRLREELDHLVNRREHGGE